MLWEGPEAGPEQWEAVGSHFHPHFAVVFSERYYCIGKEVLHKDQECGHNRKGNQNLICWAVIHTCGWEHRKAAEMVVVVVAHLVAGDDPEAGIAEYEMDGKVSLLGDGLKGETGKDLQVEERAECIVAVKVEGTADEVVVVGKEEADGADVVLPGSVVESTGLYVGSVGTDQGFEMEVAELVDLVEQKQVD